MSLSNSRHAYLDCFALLDRALEDPRGIRAEVPSLANAIRLRLRIHQARAIDRAASTEQAGTVVLLAAVGMQTPAWSGVPAEALYHAVAALRAVGMDGEARMIAAEAIARG